MSALMHDSVLAALIAAERADDERASDLAVGMAREALTRLANTERAAGEGSDEPRGCRAIADGIERDAASCSDLGARRDRRGVDAADPRPRGACPRPGGRPRRSATRCSTPTDGDCTSRCAATARRPGCASSHDTGAGFDLDGVPDDRLGIRASIIARVAAVGGTARIASNPRAPPSTLEWGQPES